VLFLLGIIPNMKRFSEPQEIEQRLMQSLQEKGYKLTTQRLAIIKLLAKETTHPGAIDILRKVRKTIPQISLSTVYYTLDMLKREGLIHEIEFYDRDNRYDVNVTNHINLICNKCGKIEDFPGEVPYSAEAVKEKTGFQPIGMRFEYYGYCKECGRKQKR
jgi:Fe2+ or Zn2+ uptake regulation protein